MPLTPNLKKFAMVQGFKNLLLFCPQPLYEMDLKVNSSGGEIGIEGWQLLENTVQLRPGFVENISCEHHVLRSEGGHEDDLENCG